MGNKPLRNIVKPGAVEQPKTKQQLAIEAKLVLNKEKRAKWQRRMHRAVGALNKLAQQERRLEKKLLEP